MLIIGIVWLIILNYKAKNVRLNKSCAGALLTACLVIVELIGKLIRVGVGVGILAVVVVIVVGPRGQNRLIIVLN